MLIVDFDFEFKFDDISRGDLQSTIKNQQSKINNQKSKSNCA
jgi:hypothetical protein